MTRELAQLLGRILLIFIIIEVLLHLGLLWVALGSYFLAFVALLFKPNLLEFKFLWGILFVILTIIKFTGGN